MTTKMAAATAALLFTLFASAVGQAQEQNVNRFRASAEVAKAMRARATSITIPDNSLPPIAGAAIVVTGGLNGDQSRLIQMNVMSPQGWYYVFGVLSDGANTQITLGSWDFENVTGLATIPIVEGNLSQVIPGMKPIWEVGVVHFNAGSTEELVTLWDQSAGTGIKVANDQFVNGVYTMSLTGDISDIISVGVGPYGFASQIGQYAPGGMFANFPAGLYLPDGYVTITVCRKTGWCYTDTYRPQASNSSDGKG